MKQWQTTGRKPRPLFPWSLSAACCVLLPWKTVLSPPGGLTGIVTLAGGAHAFCIVFLLCFVHFPFTWCFRSLLLCKITLKQSGLNPPFLSLAAHLQSGRRALSGSLGASTLAQKVERVLDNQQCSSPELTAGPSISHWPALWRGFFTGGGGHVGPEINKR